MLTYQPAGQDKIKYEAAMPAHRQAVELVLKQLTNPENGILKSIDEIDAVGHRMVHGGEKFACSTLLTDDVLKTVESCNDLAPLHNPPTLVGVAACRELLPTTPMVGVFDTAFHQTMPPEAYIYGLPYEYYEKYAVRRYGLDVYKRQHRQNCCRHYTTLYLHRRNNRLCHSSRTSAKPCHIINYRYPFLSLHISSKPLLYVSLHHSRSF